jgi:hypothetical protein
MTDSVTIEFLAPPLYPYGLVLSNDPTFILAMKMKGSGDWYRAQDVRAFVAAVNQYIKVLEEDRARLTELLTPKVSHEDQVIVPNPEGPVG